MGPRGGGEDRSPDAGPFGLNRRHVVRPRGGGAGRGHRGRRVGSAPPECRGPESVRQLPLGPRDARAPLASGAPAAVRGRPRPATRGPPAGMANRDSTVAPMPPVAARRDRPRRRGRTTTAPLAPELGAGAPPRCGRAGGSPTGLRRRPAAGPLPARRRRRPRRHASTGSSATPSNRWTIGPAGGRPSPLVVVVGAWSFRRCWPTSAASARIGHTTRRDHPDHHDRVGHLHGLRTTASRPPPSSAQTSPPPRPRPAQLVRPVVDRARPRLPVDRPRYQLNLSTTGPCWVDVTTASTGRPCGPGPPSRAEPVVPATGTTHRPARHPGRAVTLDGIAGGHPGAIHRPRPDLRAPSVGHLLVDQPPARPTTSAPAAGLTDRRRPRSRSGG